MWILIWIQIWNHIQLRWIWKWRWPMNLNLISTYLYKYEYDQIHHDSPWSWRWCSLCQVDMTKSCGSGHGKHQPTAQLEVEETEELMLLSQTCRFVDDERETNLIPDIRFCLGKLTIWHRGCLQKTDGDFLFAFQVSGKAICNSRVKVIFLRREDFKRRMEFRKSAVLSLILMNMKSNMVDSPFIRPAISWGKTLDAIAGNGW